MATEVIVAIITGGVTSLGTILGFIATTKSTKQKEEEARQKHLADLEDRITEKLATHKEEYIQEINSVKDSIKDINSAISEMQAGYQTTVATVSLQIANLEKAQNKHNEVITRTYELEKNVAVLMNREKVSENRLADLEKKQ